MKRKSFVEEFQSEMQGQTVTVKRLRPKGKKKSRTKPRNTAICPECGSVLKVSEHGPWECTGNQLEIWISQFSHYQQLGDLEKQEYLTEISDLPRFEYLYGRWEASLEEENAEPFTCGYTNDMSLPISSMKISLPDPLFVKHLEKRIGRKLTEEEKHNEEPLWFSGGMYIAKYKKGAKKVRIPKIIFPDEV